MAAPTVTTAAMRTIAADAADAGGAVTVAGVTARTNYCTNPSMVTDTDGNGLANGWDVTIFNTATAPTNTLSASGQRFRYTGVAADAGRLFLPMWATAGGTFAPGDPVTVSATFSGAISGTTFWIRVASSDVSQVDRGNAQSAAITLSSTPTRYSVTLSACGALSDRVYLMLGILNIDNGDTIDITIDDVLIEKSASLGDYFDGSSSGGYWTGTANASASVCDGITARGTCWSTAANPTTADSKTDDHSHATPGNVSTFTSAIAGLTPGAVYHARAYAVNADGTSYGADAPFAAHSSNLPVIGCAFIKGGRQCQ